MPVQRYWCWNPSFSITVDQLWLDGVMTLDGRGGIKE